MMATAILTERTTLAMFQRRAFTLFFALSSFVIFAKTEGTLNMKISQSGSTLVVTSNVKTEEGDCEDDFEFSAGSRGSYISNTGAISITSAQDGNTLSLNGIATEQDGNIRISGQWSVIDTASADVVSAGTWSAESD